MKVLHNSDKYFCFVQLQIDLEPEGRVYVVIDLSGSSGEGKVAQFYCFYSLTVDFYLLLFST